jgi:hypothetical protein
MAFVHAHWIGSLFAYAAVRRRKRASAQVAEAGSRQ